MIENLLLGDSRALRLDVAGARAAARGVRRDARGRRSIPTRRAGDLALGRQQQVEIIKALWRGSRVLILDEPTSMLTPQAVRELQSVLERLKRARRSRSSSSPTSCTRPSRSATGSRSCARAALTGAIDRERVRASSPEELESEIVRLMFGEALATRTSSPSCTSASRGTAATRPPTTRRGRARARARVTPAATARSPGIEDVSLTLRLGEVLGVAGVDGNGQRALAEAISGQRRLTHGEIRYLGAPIGSLSVAQREKLGLRYVTDDRLGEGIVAALPVSINLVLKRIGQPPYWRHGRIRRDAIDRDARGAGRALRHPHARHPRARRHALGRQHPEGPARPRAVGRRQGRRLPQADLRPRPEDDPRRARDDRRACATAARRCVISTDLDELLEVSDRIAVLSRGRIVGEVENGPGAAEQVGRLMIGDVTLGVEAGRGGAAA